jgi:RNA polymerase sigma-70 factor (ECF subfamily)
MVAVHLDPRLAARLDPSDVVQETLADAARRLPQYLAERPIPFYAWLRQIAWERLARLHEQHVKAKKRSVAKEERWQLRLPDSSVADLAGRLVGRSSSPSGHLARREIIRRVRAALDQLPPLERELLVLRYVEQLPFKEVAAIQGASEGTTRTRHFRALRRVHELLEDELESDQP